MKDWTTLQPDVVRLMGKHFTVGRGGERVEGVVRHHLAGIGSTEDVWGWWQTRQASCHYVVEDDGRIGQLVWDDNTAWHAADTMANRRSIGIEHANITGRNDANPGAAWNISDTTLDQGAHLAAAILRFYDLGAPKMGVNVFDHRNFTSTSCPHHLAVGGKYHDFWMERAQYWYRQMGAPAATTEEDDMALAPEDKKQLNRIEDTLAEVLRQLGQPGGWEQGGGRTLYDLTAAVAEIEGVPNTRDTLG